MASQIKTDAQLQRDVLEELKWDTRVVPTHVGVEVARGTVTLTGTVESWGERLAAQEAAHRVLGVLDVANDVHVKPPNSSERTDADIARAVRSALEWDVVVPDVRIRATVSSGVVTLEGDVDCWSQFDDAARAVRNLAGVREVENKIAVESSASSVSPQSVRAAIQAALERRADRAASQVEISIADGTVILTGEVPSRAEVDAVEAAARATPGVRRIDSRIRTRA